MAAKEAHICEFCERRLPTKRLIHARFDDYSDVDGKDLANHYVDQFWICKRCVKPIIKLLMKMDGDREIMRGLKRMGKLQRKK